MPALNPSIVVGSVWPDSLAIRDDSQGGWDNDTPVPPVMFGPLWPDGTPRGWPEDSHAQTQED